MRWSLTKIHEQIRKIVIKERERERANVKDLDLDAGVLKVPELVPTGGKRLSKFPQS